MKESEEVESREVESRREEIKGKGRGVCPCALYITRED